MRAPLSWLCDYAPFDQPVEQLADTLSGLGLVVDGVERVGAEVPGVVVARILDIRPHPAADRIRLVDVDAGGGEALQIVCGAWNMQVGDLVPLATIGAVLPNGMEISRRKMRGEWSNGMLCAPGEIGLPEPAGHDGLLILPPGAAAPGAPIREATGGPDVVFDLDISPNRPDALCMAGVARDLAAALGVPFAWPTGLPAGAAAVQPVTEDPGLERAGVEVVDADLCGRFTATVLGGVRVGASPTWLATRLTLAGMRPISNVVDVSNYVMLDVGQPNHAYDLDRLGGRSLIIRRAAPGETLVTLDGVERRMEADDLLICDGRSTPVGVAGIMGGADSEISEQTTTVLLEAAWFAPMAVARTGIRLGLTSEARHRFERGVDPEIADRAVDRFAQLLAATLPAGDGGDGDGGGGDGGDGDGGGGDGGDGDGGGGGDAGDGGGGDRDRPGLRRGATVDARSDADLPPVAVLDVRTARVNAVLGVELRDADIAGLLQPIGFESAPTSTGVQAVTVPTWRPDVEREVDVIEEVARLYGYPNIARRVPASARAGALTPGQRDRRRVRDILAGAGLDEAWTSTFLAPGDLERAGLPGPAVTVSNPLDQAESVLRSSLLPGLLGAARSNADRQLPDVRLFETGRVFAPPAEGAVTPTETDLLAIVLAGAGGDATTATRLWGILRDGLRLDGTRLTAGEAPGMHPTRTARIETGDGQVLGAVGEVDPDVVAAWGLTGRVGWLSVDLDALLAAPRRTGQAQPVSRYPASDFDLAFAVPEVVPAAAVADSLRRATGGLLEDLALFDVFRGAQLGGDRRSLAFRLRLRAQDRTLADEELAAARRAAIDAVVADHGAELRA